MGVQGKSKSSNVVWHEAAVTREKREQANGHRSAVLWFTGLSGSGKTTLTQAVEERPHVKGAKTFVIDGDNVRHGLNRDLGFTDVDRVENIRRVAEVTKLFVDSGMIVLSSFISPFRDERKMARDMLDENEFFEVFVDTPIEVCEQRDPKGLYVKARAGEIKHFTGIESDYEKHENPEINLKSADFSVEELADQVIEKLKTGGFI